VVKLRKRKRTGDRLTVHTPNEIVHCQVEDNFIVASCKSSSAVRALKRKGFEVFNSVSAPDTKNRFLSESSNKELKYGIEFDILRASVDDLCDELSSGKHDAHLENLLECEKGSKSRKTAIEAIKSRISRPAP
jgi:hypothetical protein